MSLPVLAALLLATVACDPTHAPPPAGTIRVVAIGDSITKGERDGVGADQTFTALVQAGLGRRGFAAEVVNVGVGGEHSDDGLARFDEDVVARKPEVVTIMYGTNDSFVDEGETSARIPIERYRANLTAMIDAALAAGIRPVLMTEPRWGPRARNGLGENPNPRLEAYVVVCREIARERGLELVDHFADWKKAEENGIDVGTWTVDQCHPNPDGHRRLAALIEPAVLEALGERSRVAPDIVVHRDLDYAGAGNPRQTLDVYLPRSPKSPKLPLVVFFHGGAWEEGDKDELVGMIFPLVSSGEFAGASANYRLTVDGPHPAQIHDAKGAIRWLRANARAYDVDPDRVAVFGISAGGHLASLVGTSAGAAELEGVVGGHPDQSSRVSAVVNFCGPSNFQTLAGQQSRLDPNDPASAIGRLLGGAVSGRAGAAVAASPVTYISADDPPFLHIHGSADDVVPYAQTVDFDASLEAAGISSTVLTGDGAGHLFYNDGVRDGVRAFLSQVLLRQGPAVRDAKVAP